jgi:hypothetical protein
MSGSTTIQVTPLTATNSAAFSAQSLSDAEKTDVRRFCGYPPYGGEGMAGFQGWRFYQAYGLMEFRMNNMSPAEYQVIRYHLNFLIQLEVALVSSSNNLDTDAAAVWTHNKQEVADRRGLYHEWRVHLCAATGVPPGPGLSKGGRVVI